jgi:hypothetical protein
MEKKYNSLTIFEFQEQFKEDKDCLSYLAAQKWREGYVCGQCGHSHYFELKKGYRTVGSVPSVATRNHPTAGTLFHKVKFSLLKAFYIVYYVSGNKKGISSTELNRKLDLLQKTCWLFKQKVIVAMRSSGNYLLQKSVEVDETTIVGQEDGTRGVKKP